MDLPSSDFTNKTSTGIKGDNPIRNSQEDVLGRVDVAKSFAQHVLALDASEGAVVGVLGPWGSGKTSFINLARIEFMQKGIHVLDFNPWMFSGAEYLVERFFTDLTSQLKIRPGLVEVGKALEDYSEIFFKVIPWAKLIGKFLQGEKGGLIGRRDKVSSALYTLNKPIVIVLDDVDRLSASEIRDVFKLVRLTGSFPNIVYIVACDRFRVEQALEEQGSSGRDYLEKILQLPFDLPEVPNHILQEQIGISINGILTGIEDANPLDAQVWPDIFMEIVQPLIRNMRDVRRYVATLRGTIIGLNGRVALADMFGLEAVRIFLPDVFKLIPGVIDSLTVPSTSRNAGRRPENEFEEMVPPERKTWRQEPVKRLIDAAKTHEGVVRSVLIHLFPVGMKYINGDVPDQGNQWQDKLLIDRRVAHEDILRLYMERVTGGDLPAYYDAEGAFALMNDRNALDQFIRSLEPRLWPDLIIHLSRFEFHREHVEPGIFVLFNLFPEWPDYSRPLYPARITKRNITHDSAQAISNYQADSYARKAVKIVASRLLKVLENPAELKAVLRRVLSNLKSLYSKTELVRLLGKQKNDDRLVPVAEVAEFEEMLLRDVQSMSADDLARDRNLAWDLNFIMVVTKRLNMPFDIDKIDCSHEVNLAILRSAILTVSSSDDPDIRLGLRWDLLTSIYGDETTLMARIKSLQQWVETQQAPPSDAQNVLEIASLYPDRSCLQRMPDSSSTTP